jgi:hypothetical protein
MSGEQAKTIFERTKNDALTIARDVASKLRRKSGDS